MQRNLTGSRPPRDPWLVFYNFSLYRLWSQPPGILDCPALSDQYAFKKHNTPKERGEHSFISCSPRSDFFIFGFVLRCHRSAPLMHMDFCCRLGGLLMNSRHRCVILVLLLCLSSAWPDATRPGAARHDRASQNSRKDFLYGTEQ